jgi:hypothetical protein
MVLIDYFKQMARRVHAAVRSANPLDGLAEDLTRFLELEGSQWSCEPTQLYSQLKSHHKLKRANEFGKMVRAAVKRQRGLTFDDGHERIIRPDGSASTRRVMKMKLIETL